MSKLYTPLILLFFVLIMNNLYAGDRMVLVERFTSWTCPPCASNNPIMDAFLSSQDPDRIVGISYHMNWPAPGNDSMYWWNTVDNEARRSYYGVNSIPQAFMDGIINIQPAYNPATLQAYFDSRKVILSPITIIVTDTTYGDTIYIKARIYCETVMTNPTVKIHFAVIEKHIHYQYAPGTNGETDFYDVMRKMLPSGTGSDLTLLPGQVYTIERKVYKDTRWQTSELRSMVFLQDAGREILGAGIKTANFTLLPQPGYKVVLAGQNQNATFRVRTPVIASGYNSPITFTAQVIPANAGITVTFPNGNILSNFNDSLAFQVASTSAVTAGAYRIVLTGTSASNKTHSTSVMYLVGQNYVIVGSNKYNLQYKVDGATNTTTKLFTWDIGTQHTLAAVTPQFQGANIRYVFGSWSNNGDTTQTITINTETITYIVNYKTQYKLITLLNPSGIPATITGGNTFYDSSVTANLNISPLQVQYNNQAWYFQRWQGVGTGSYTGTNPNPQIIMNNIISETAIWDTIPIGIQKQGSEVPKEYALHQNYPNPFNPVTKIKFDLPVNSNIKLMVYDILGNEVMIIADSYQKAGYYEAEIDASGLASGVYFYKLTTDSYVMTKKMLVIK